MENIKDIKKGVRISKGIATSAELYLYKDVLYKLFNDSKELEIKEEVLSTLHKLPINGCSNIYSLIYDKELKGYGMEYYEDYKVLKKVRKISFNLKKEYCHKLIEIYKNLKELGFIYYDFHTQNILVNSDDLKLIDIDSCLNITKENEILGSRYLNELVLSIVFDTYFFEYMIYFSKQTRKEIQEILYSGLSYDYNEKGSLDELDYYIQNIEKRDIKDLKKRLPKNILK